MFYFNEIMLKDIRRKGGNLGHFNNINLSLRCYSWKTLNYRFIEKKGIDSWTPTIPSLIVKWWALSSGWHKSEVCLLVLSQGCPADAPVGAAASSQTYLACMSLTVSGAKYLFICCCGVFFFLPSFLNCQSLSFFYLFLFILFYL